MKLHEIVFILIIGIALFLLMLMDLQLESLEARIREGRPIYVKDSAYVCKEKTL